MNKSRLQYPYNPIGSSTDSSTDSSTGSSTGSFPETLSLICSKAWYRLLLNTLSLPMASILFALRWKKIIIQTHFRQIRTTSDGWSLIKFYHNLCFELFSFLFGRLSGTLEIPPPSRKAIAEARDRGGLILCAHFGNFELMGFALREMGLPMKAIAQPLKHNGWDNLLHKLRSRAGDYTFPLTGSLSQISRLLRNQTPVAFLADQEARGKHIPLTFCGHSFRASPLPDLLIRRTEVPLFQALMFRKENGNYQLFFQHISDYQSAYFNNLTNIIHQYPHQWFNASHRMYFRANTQMYSPLNS